MSFAILRTRYFYGKLDRATMTVATDERRDFIAGIFATEQAAEDHIEWIEENGEKYTGRGYRLAQGEFALPTFEILPVARA